MNERFIRCSECGMPHEAGVRLCPATGKVIARPPGSSSAMRAAAPYDPVAHPPTPQPPRPDALPPPGRVALATVDFELIGRVIGEKYRIREVLGEGGMGTVFEALHEQLGNLVAIKILRPSQLQNVDAVRRFHQEARAAARIGHPNICEVYDVGTLDDGRPYLVMERLRGATLADRIQTKGGLPVEQAVDTLTQVLSGLHAAHEKRIIHRDVKPENVFLSERVGCPPLAKILDFGVSKVIEQQTEASGFGDIDSTRAGVVLGTPFYLAPEQAREDRNLDARVDLYACGVMLYEALTGRRPFDAPNYHALVLAILTSTPRPAREIRPDLPPRFERILEKAMHRHPDERYQTALEFQAALQQYSQAGLAASAITPSPPPPQRTSTSFPLRDPPLIPGNVPHTPPPPSIDEDVQAYLKSAPHDQYSEPPPPAPHRPPTLPPRAPARIASRRIGAPSAHVRQRAVSRSTPPPAFVATQRSRVEPEVSPTERPLARPTPARPDETAPDLGLDFDDVPTEVSFPRSFPQAKDVSSPRPSPPPTPPRPDAKPSPDRRLPPPFMEPPLHLSLARSPNECTTEVAAVPLLRPEVPDQVMVTDPVPVSAPRRPRSAPEPLFQPPVPPPMDLPPELPVQPELDSFFGEDSATEVMAAPSRSDFINALDKKDPAHPVAPPPDSRRPPPRR
jgi:serine/threonine-protein kinase